MRTTRLEKKIISLLVIISMILISIPQAAFASAGERENQQQKEITVYFTLSEDNHVRYAEGTGELLVHVPVKVSYFDLAEYNMGEFTKKDENGNVIEEPVLLHGMIRFLEQYYNHGNKIEVPSEALTPSGKPESLFLTRFFGHDGNLLHYVNHSYPLMRPGWGATADWYPVSEGDCIDIELSSDNDFYKDNVFTYFTESEKEVLQGQPFELQLKGTLGGLGNDESTADMEDAGLEYTSDGGKVWHDIEGRTDKNGKITVTFNEPGEYVIVNKTAGRAADKEIANFAVAGTKVTVEETQSENVKHVMKLIDSIGTADLEKGDAIREARDAYNLLTEEEKSQVTNINKLEQAEKEYRELEEAERIRTAEQAISAIGKVTLESGPAISKAEKLYNSLTEEEKEKVENAEVLFKAEETYNKIVSVSDLEEGTIAMNRHFTETKGGYKITTSGRQIHAEPVVKNVDGTLLQENRDYTVEYNSSKRIEPGKYTVKVTGMGNYRGTLETAVYIVPEEPAATSIRLSKEKGGYDDIILEWTKCRGASGYSVVYKKKGDKNWSEPVRTTKTSFSKKNLNDGYNYEFRVRSYYKSEGTRYMSMDYASEKISVMKKVKLESVKKCTSSKVRVKWGNIAGESGYEISRSSSKTGTNIVCDCDTAKDSSRVIRAKKNKGYYYKVRAYRIVEGRRVYAPWSSLKYYKVR